MPKPAEKPAEPKPAEQLPIGGRRPATTIDPLRAVPPPRPPGMPGMMPPERLPGPIIQNMHIDEVDPGGVGLPDDDVIVGDDDDGLDMDNWRNYTVATDAWEEFKVGNTYRNLYYKPRPRTGRQSTAKFYTQPPGHRGDYIRSLRHHEEIGPVLSITTHGAYNRDFVTLEVPQKDARASVMRVHPSS